MYSTPVFNLGPMDIFQGVYELGWKKITSLLSLTAN
jgi:hypothetical protein